jgi:exosortase/archaeosortase
MNLELKQKTFNSFIVWSAFSIFLKIVWENYYPIWYYFIVVLFFVLIEFVYNYMTIKKVKDE